MKIYKLENFEYWYDPHNRSWWAMQVDKATGYQVGDALNAYTKQEIIFHVKQEIKNSKDTT